MKIIISAGGTGGHIFPAIAVADEIKKRLPNAEILFVGAEGKMEMERVPKAGYPIEGLWIAGFQRKLTLQNLLFPIKLISSLWKARQIVKRFRPDVVVGFGGFASGPTLKVANQLGTPTLLQEQNSYAGVTNKLLAQKAEKICVAYDNMQQFFPAEKLILTGNPVRHDVWQLKDKNSAIEHFGLAKGKKTIFIVGGSLGAKTLNLAMEENANFIALHQESIQIIWQCGKLYEEDFKNGKAANLPNVKMLTFIDRMDLAYSAADVVVARSGALTISELCLVGVPTIFIPSPNVAEDHQTKNAMALVTQSAALIVKDVVADKQMLTTAFSLLEDEILQQQLRTNMLTLGKPKAAADIAEEVIKIGNQ